MNINGPGILEYLMYLFEVFGECSGEYIEGFRVFKASVLKYSGL